VKIGVTRPYPPTGMTTERWREIDPEWVDLDHLTSTQDGVLLEPLLMDPGLHKSHSGDCYPHVVSWQGHQYLEDGHTRVARYIINRHSVMRMRVLVMEAHDGV
jgi:hypothetical protein